MPRARRAVARGPKPALAAKRRRDRLETAATVLAGLALVFGAGLHWLVGTGFIQREWCSHSLEFLVTHDVCWAAALATTVAGPVWFWWWRRSAAAGGALIGMAISVASSVSVTLCAGTADHLATNSNDPPRGSFVLMLASGLVCAAAFRIAPAPHDPEALNELQVRGLVRRSRREAPRPAPSSSASDIALLRRHESNARTRAGLVTVFGGAIVVLWLVAADAGSLVWTTTRNPGCWPRREAESLAELVASHGTWTACALTMAAAAALYLVWQAGALPYGRSVGIVACGSAALGVTFDLVRMACRPGCSVDECAWLVPLASAAFAFLFALVPPPRDPKEENAFELRRRMRRHRAEFEAR